MIRYCLFIVFCGGALAGISYVKDQRTDHIEFPPKIGLRRGSSPVPEGHLRPLGWQRKPEGPVMEEEEPIDAETFHHKYVKHKKPVVFRNAMQNVPAVKRWEDDYLKKTHGSIQVSVTIKKQEAKPIYQKMSLKDFIRGYHSEEWYLSTIVPQELMKDLRLPRMLQCGTSRKYLQMSELWMSSGGTASLLHSHADENIHCVLAGRKDFILIHQKELDKPNLEVEEEYPHARSYHSNLDMDFINVFKNYKFQETPWIWSTLREGDCLYEPAGYFHQVRSYGRSLSSTYLWAPSPDYDASDCKNMKPDTEISLADTTFFWTYINNAKQLSNIKLNDKSLLHHLLMLMRDDGHLHSERFEAFYNELMNEVKKEHPSAQEVFKILTPSGKDLLYRQEVLKLDPKTLKQVADILNMPHSKHLHDEL